MVMLMGESTTPHERLKLYLRENGVNSRILTFEKHTMTVEDAEMELGVGRERIIKSILFTDEKGMPVIGIVTGDKKSEREKTYGGLWG